MVLGLTLGRVSILPVVRPSTTKESILIMLAVGPRAPLQREARSVLFIIGF